MLLTEIPRIKPGLAIHQSLGALEGERAKLATRAADLLGYRGLANHVSGRTMVGVEKGKLTETLRALDLDVLDSAAVIDYQLTEAARLTKEKITEDFRDWTIGYFSPAQWHHTLLTEYDKPVPEFVLDKAIRIKEALPEVIFRIQYISEPKADPFLIAQLDKEIYYIEAWDEPRFERSL
jgi:hypothetical protein